MGISKHMDLRIPFQLSSTNDIKEVECECCGISEDCTRAYIQHIRARFYGKWVCGLCSEVIIEESYKLGRVHNLVHEEALHSHMEICKKFNNTIRANPAMYLAGVMTQILKKGSRGRDLWAHPHPLELEFLLSVSSNQFPESNQRSESI
ncbi:hypothetical protein TEA_026909 [Camellia sinensis var. sinensis]|uniref:DUF1677 domain-containing protein n=1 Tax=Camellia sinensis var. sinensis TaxID=542762 RepID=A0A4S4E0X0_CAMSN|nr:hypothetical protein TEA_026909 [Camellia sinensis var. sinensis]